jgi:hypothetical protein
LLSLSIVLAVAMEVALVPRLASAENALLHDKVRHLSGRDPSTRDVVNPQD